MEQTYAVCDQCGQLNRVQLKTNKEAICGACKAALPIHGAVVEAADRSLSKLIAKSPLPVVIDVWAQWCGPCRAFAPTFKEASDKFAGKAVFVKLDSENNPGSAGQLGIQSIPTILVFKNGTEVTRQSGAMGSEHFSHWLTQQLEKT